MSQGHLHWIFLQIYVLLVGDKIHRIEIDFSCMDIAYFHTLLYNYKTDTGLINVWGLSNEESCGFFLLEIYFPLHEERNHLVGLVEVEGYYHW